MDVHWRNTQKPARFFIFDARAAVAVMLFLVHMRLWTLLVVIVIMIIFWIFERFGLTFDSAIRAVRCWFLGIIRPANKRSGRRYWIDSCGR